eukprot:scaffold11830_cov20-Tisochrysis_lutea.AAC.3
MFDCKSAQAFYVAQHTLVGLLSWHSFHFLHERWHTHKRAHTRTHTPHQAACHGHAGRTAILCSYAAAGRAEWHHSAGGVRLLEHHQQHHQRGDQSATRLQAMWQALTSQNKHDMHDMHGSLKLFSDVHEIQVAQAPTFNDVHNMQIAHALAFNDKQIAQALALNDKQVAQALPFNDVHGMQVAQAPRGRGHAALCREDYREHLQPRRRLGC